MSELELEPFLLEMVDYVNSRLLRASVECLSLRAQRAPF